MTYYTKSEAHAYWKSPNRNNKPENYVDPLERSTYVVDFIKDIKVKKIIELGCSVGRNIFKLKLNGYEVAGVEINEKAKAVTEGHFGDLNIVYCPVEEYVKETEKYDLTLTMAFLEHLPKESEWIFEHIKSEYLVTIEDEGTDEGYHYKRNYKTVFEKHGYKQIKEEKRPADLQGMFMARLFKR